MRSSIAFCTSLFADRSGVAASRILLVAAACVILLCFAAESCKSHCNGGVRVANAALAAKFVDFGTIHFPFKILFKKGFKIFCKLALCKSFSVQKLALCKRLLRVEAPLRKSLLCVKVSSLCKSLLCVKASLCKSFSV